ncbi:hypothetical protein SDC9_158797 [bioreactor metagenome]|uniref:Uncharacterized protein n=1 Tax=bioreactor metagenome TaxID=1076179 RepID=A0A645FG73_9ZZZZ
MQFKEEFEETAVAAIRPGVGAVVFLFPLFEPCGIAVAVGDDAVPDGVEVILVDQVDHHQRRVFGVGQPGVGVAVGHPVADERLPVLHRGGFDREKRFRLREISRNPVAFPERAAGIEVGRQVDAAFFQRGEKVVEPVERLRVQRGGIRRAGRGQPVVVVVEPHGVVAVARDLFGHLFRRLLRREVGTLAEVGSVKFQPAFRRLFEPQRTVGGGTDKTVFPGGSVEPAGKIKRAAFRRTVFEFQRMPFRPG